MKNSGSILLLSILFIVATISFSAKKIARDTDADYIFFLHNKFVELQPDSVVHPKYGRAEYVAILDTFRNAGFVVISERRAQGTDVLLYAKKVAAQVDSLIKRGVKPGHITVIGTSKGGYIAQYVSTLVANPGINYVFIGSYQDADLHELPAIQFCGNILSIYEKSDYFGVSAIKRAGASKLKVTRFKEIELNTNLEHGFLYHPLPGWIEPCKMWARREYELLH